MELDPRGRGHRTEGVCICEDRKSEAVRPLTKLLIMLRRHS